MNLSDQQSGQDQPPTQRPQSELESGVTNTAHTREAERNRSIAWEIVETILLALLIFVMVRGVVLNFRVDGNSMEPSLHNSEMLIVNRRAYSTVDFSSMFSWLPGVEDDEGDGRYIFGPPERGEVIVFRPPNGQNEPYIKRIIGLPGEEITIMNGDVYIDGIALDEDYVASATSWRGGGAHSNIVVPEDHVFVLGDNRSNSSDSRVFGTVPVDDVIGKAWVAYWPPESAQLLPVPAYASHE